MAANSPAAASSPTAAKPPGIVTARAVDGSGSPTGITDSFDRSTDNRIVIAVPSDGMPGGTTYSYTRYVGGKYLDSRSVRLTHPSRYCFFETNARPGHTLVAGHYRYQIYRNRGFMGAVEFDVR
jgi:hypothetical protein